MSPIEVPPKRAKLAKQGKKYTRKYKPKPADATLPAGVLQHEIAEIMKLHKLAPEQIANDMREILNDEAVEKMYHRTVENVEILRLSSSGDGLALLPHPVNIEGRQVAVVPFGLVGDIVTVRVFKLHPQHVECDLLRIEKASEDRNDELINCSYFGKCSGCQYQNVAYETQLEYKRLTIRNAYRYFAPTIGDKLPEVGATFASPLQYGYRTKLTPHFNVPRHMASRPNLGFGAKGRPEWRCVDSQGQIMDIEECAIGTRIVNQGMRNERRRFEESYKGYKRGATILLREHTVEGTPSIGSTDETGAISTLSEGVLTKLCVTEPRAIVQENVAGFTFEFSAGEFFQNNNSILPLVTLYVREKLQLGAEAYLVDAYCGSGLFSVTCLGGVSRVVGVEVSADSVKFAKRNAERNNVGNAEFLVGKAERLFEEIDLPADKTLVILDPPRKGCDDVFLKQLSAFRPARIVYISCNVHSQARDIEWFLTRTENGGRYEVESIRGFDFFPQTHHVESVAVLRLDGMAAN